MQNNQGLLLKNLLLSSSGINILKYDKDSKAKRKVRINYFGLSLLYIMLMCYCAATIIGYGMLGLINIVPALCALTILPISFLFTLLKTNGYLFAFKEYDMLMSLPFPTKSVVGAKFLYMYIKSLPWILSISISMLVGYGIFASPALYVYPLWLILTLVLPLPAMIIASAFGVVIAAIGSRFRHKQLIQAFFTFVFVILIFVLRFAVEAMVRDDQTDEVLYSIADAIDSAKVYLPSASWFEAAIVKGSIPCILLLIGLAILLFEVFIIFVGKYYRQINSRLMTGSARKNFRMKAQGVKSIPNSIAFKEFKLFTGSVIYLTNAGLGELFVVITSIALFFVDVNSVISSITSGSPLTKENLIPAIPIILYFFLGMVATTACSYSLEGKNLWILKSLPIKMTDVMKGKMLFNMYLTVPFGIFGCICYGINFGADAISILLSILCIIALCAFSTALGMFVNMNHPRFDWTNEVEVVKQGASVAIYLFPNMFLTMGLCVLVVALGFVANPLVVSLIITFISAAAAALFYLLVINKAKKL